MTASHIKLVKPNRVADAKLALRHVFIRDLMLPCSIGIHHHEKITEQRVRINLDLAVLEGDRPINDDIRNVICYEHLARGIEEIARPGPTLPSIHQTKEQFERQWSALPLKRQVLLEEICRAVRFLLDAPSITGQMIVLDGGQHLGWAPGKLGGKFSE